MQGGPCIGSLSIRCQYNISSSHCSNSPGSIEFPARLHFSSKAKQATDFMLEVASLFPKIPHFVEEYPYFIGHYTRKLVQSLNLVVSQVNHTMGLHTSCTLNFTCSAETCVNVSRSTSCCCRFSFVVSCKVSLCAWKVASNVPTFAHVPYKNLLSFVLSL